MKKSLIALAVAGAFAAPLAMADVKIGGEIDVAAESFDNGDNSGLQLNNTHTRWWFDNVDDIGNGLSVLAHFEMDQGASGATPINNRNSFIGLKGDWGLVKMGTEEGIYEQLGYQVDQYHGAAGPAGNIVNGLGQNALTGTVCGKDNWGCHRLGNTISYVSPTISGFNGKVDYTANGPAGTTAPANEKETVLQAGAYWAGDMGGTGVRAGLGFIEARNFNSLAVAAGATGATGGVNSKDSGVRGTLGATFGDFMIDGLWEANKWTQDAGTAVNFGGTIGTVSVTEVKNQHFWLQGTYNMPSGKVILSYIHLGKNKVNGTEVEDTDGSQFGAGYYYNLSKSSAAYVIYSKLSNKDNAQYSLQDGSTAKRGEDPSAIAVGLYTTF